MFRCAGVSLWAPLGVSASRLRKVRQEGRRGLTDKRRAHRGKALLVVFASSVVNTAGDCSANLGTELASISC